MINLVFAYCLQTSQSAPSVRWVAQLMGSQRAISVTTKVSHTSSRFPAFTTHQISSTQQLDGDLKIIPLDLKPAQEAANHAFALLNEGKMQEAFVFFSTFERNHPELRGFDDSVAIDCELLSGHYEEAYKDLVSLVKERSGPSSMIGDQIYLRLALASAGIGQLYDGQDEYCIERFHRHYSESWDPSEKKILRTSNGEFRRAIILSSLALAVSTACSQAYLEFVLKLDPTNDLAGHILIQYDDEQGRYSDLRRISRFMIEHAKDEDSKEFYRKKIVPVAGLADRPRRIKSAVTP